MTIEDKLKSMILDNRYELITSIQIALDHAKENNDKDLIKFCYNELLEFKNIIKAISELRYYEKKSKSYFYDYFEEKTK